MIAYACINSVYGRYSPAVAIRHGGTVVCAVDIHNETFCEVNRWDRREFYATTVHRIVAVRRMLSVLAAVLFGFHFRRLYLLVSFI